MLIMILYFILFSLLILVDGLSSDGLAIIIVILAVGLAMGVAVIGQLRSQTNKFVETQKEMSRMNAI